MTRQQINFLNEILAEIVNQQVDLSQPIYVIASFWCGRFDGIATIYSTDGDNDFEEIKKVFMDKYAWKENQIGVTEQTYELVRIDLMEILDWEGRKNDNTN